LKLKKHAPVLIDQENSQSLFNEMIRTIRNRIKYVSANQHLKSLVVTSTSEREGKSFFVANLALSVANLGKKVLVIDGNLRGDGINNYFNLPSVVGLTDYISDHIELERILQKTDIDGLDVILSGSTPVDPGKIVEADSMHGLIKEMADRYDLVIVDTPAMRTASDALIFGGYTDGSILMVQAGRVRKAYFNNVIDLFKMADVNLLGVVLNRVDNDASLI
jgi:capsular exopolysaccharide synthesis family protein